jgi:hypothetical protein
VARRPARPGGSSPRRGRPARRATPSRLARTRSQVAKQNLEELEKVAQEALAKGIQGFAVKSMNSLAEMGPAWTGEFSASWGFAPEGMTPYTPGTTGKIYRYSKSDVPLRDVVRYLKDGHTKFIIGNTSEHAAIAIDEEDALFFPPKSFPQPIKPPVEEGWGRPEDPHLRFQIDPFPKIDKETGVELQPYSQITAEKYWYQTYLRGGHLQNDLNIGFKAFMD